jgi:hypothetical protein
VWLAIMVVESSVCTKDPCQNIARALVGTCQPRSEADFSCDCQAGSLWDDDTNACFPGTLVRLHCYIGNFLKFVFLF